MWDKKKERREGGRAAGKSRGEERKGEDRRGRGGGQPSGWRALLKGSIFQRRDERGSSRASGRVYRISQFARSGMGQVMVFKWYPGPSCVQRFLYRGFGALSLFVCRVFVVFSAGNGCKSVHMGVPLSSEVSSMLINPPQCSLSGRPPQLADSVCLFSVSTGVEPEGVIEHTLPVLPCKECFSSLYFG